MIDRLRLDCELLRSHLEQAIIAAEPISAWRVTETPCGLIAAFARENDAEKLLQRGDLGQVFGTPVQVIELIIYFTRSNVKIDESCSDQFYLHQVARFSAGDSRYRQAVLLRGVPWAIPLQDINSALIKQGIVIGNVERARHFVRVEVNAYILLQVWSCFA